MATIMCPFCAVPLDVGDEKRSIVAICNPQTGRIRDCDGKLWGSPQTRVHCKSDADWRDEKTGNIVIAHVLQTNPPETPEERKAREDQPVLPGLVEERV